MLHMRKQHARSPLDIHTGPIRCQSPWGNLARPSYRHHAHGIEPSLRSCARSAPTTWRQSVCGCVSMWVWVCGCGWWEMREEISGADTLCAGWWGWEGAHAPEVSGRAASPSRGAASAAHAWSCPAVAVASRSGRPTQLARRVSLQAMAVVAAPPSVARRCPSRMVPAGAMSARAPAPCSGGGGEHG